MEVTRPFFKFSLGILSKFIYLMRLKLQRSQLNNELIIQLFIIYQYHGRTQILRFLEYFFLSPMVMRKNRAQVVRAGVHPRPQSLQSIWSAGRSHLKIPGSPGDKDGWCREWLNRSAPLLRMTEARKRTFWDRE